MKSIFTHNGYKIHPATLKATMRFYLILCFVIISINSYCNNSDSTFSDLCYFSINGELALVSELDFVRLRNIAERIPVFGLYRSGENLPNYKIAISKDSIYFFSNFNGESSSSITIDSSFEKNYYLNKQHFISGENVTNLIAINITESFVKETPTDKFYDYYLEFKYYTQTIFRDTILNSYADKNYLMESLKEIEKMEIYTSDTKELKGTQGYGTRIYSNADKTLFFIRAKYDVSSYIPITGENHILWVDPETKKEQIINTRTTSYLMDNPIEIRVLVNTKQK